MDLPGGTADDVRRIRDFRPEYERAVAKLAAAEAEIEINSRWPYGWCKWCQRGWRDVRKPHEPDCPADIARIALGWGDEVLP
jgi:hypothetical protein